MVPEAEEAGNKARVLGWKKQLQEQKTQDPKIPSQKTTEQGS
jgi:hypothetical protein